MKLRFSFLLGMTLAPAWLGAQGPLVSTDHLVGFTTPIPPSITGNIDSQDIALCPPAKTLCKNVLGRPQGSFAGGTAYDPRHQSVWISEGKYLVEYNLKTCKGICKQVATLISSNAVVSGLALSDRKSLLFQLETAPGYMGVVTYDNKLCPPKPISKCTLTLGGKLIAGGIAYDEDRDLLYISISSPISTGGWTNWIFPMLRKFPCKPLCKWQFPNPCTKQFVTGLAYSACKQQLYATDGQVTTYIHVANPKICQFKIVKCCKKGSLGNYVGLAFIPGWTRKVVSKPCNGKPCPACLGITIQTSGGDPSLGNPDFAVELLGAPAPSTGILLLKVGSCGPPLYAKGFCGPFWALPPALVFPVGIPGSGCNGFAKLPLPIPPTVKLCGVHLCAQWLMLCVSGGNWGFSMSGAMDFTIASS